MKMSIRSVVRWAKGVPFIGRFVAVPIALYRLPSLYERLAYVDERLAHLEVRLGAPGQGTDTVPTNEDIQNLILSTPVALRKLRRDVDMLLRHYELEPTDVHTAIEREQ